MKVHPDYEEFVKSLNKNKVKYLIAGAHALGFHGIIRATKDIDVWIENSKKNAESFLKALKEFFDTDFSIKVEDIVEGNNIFQFGYPPVRIDVITGIKGLNFSEAWKRRIHSKYGKVKASYLSKKELIKSKEITGRKQDLLDIVRLKGLIR